MKRKKRSFFSSDFLSYQTEGILSKGSSFRCQSSFNGFFFHVRICDDADKLETKAIAYLSFSLLSTINQMYQISTLLHTKQTNGYSLIMRGESGRLSLTHDQAKEKARRFLGILHVDLAVICRKQDQVNDDYRLRFG